MNRLVNIAFYCWWPMGNWCHSSCLFILICKEIPFFLKLCLLIWLAVKQFIGTNQNVLKWQRISLSVDQWMMNGELSEHDQQWVTDNGIDIESLFSHTSRWIVIEVDIIIFLFYFFRADQLLLDDIAFWYVNLSIFSRPKSHVSFCNHQSFFVRHKTFRSLDKSSLSSLFSKLSYKANKLSYIFLWRELFKR